MKTEAGLGMPESVTSFSWERDMRESLDYMIIHTQRARPVLGMF